MKVSIKIFLVLIALGSLPAYSEEPDAAALQALKQTQELLVNPVLRDQAISQRPDAQRVDDQVKSLGGNEASTELIYKLSADIFGDLVKDAGGDVAKLQQLLLKAQGDPKAFYELLSEKNKNSLKQISRKIANQPKMAAEPARTK